MDASLSKTFKTSRGFTYRYYFAAPQGDKPTLLFAHGFPCTANSWHKQAPFFLDKGYGILVPDLLGYAGTDEPTDVAAYRMKAMVGDVVEIIDHEKVEKIVSVGHDWGSAFVSRLANYHQTDARFIAFAFIAVSYFPPAPDLDVHKINAMLKPLVGYEPFGYQLFFIDDPDASKILMEHIDSSPSIMFPKDHGIWKTNMCPPGTLKQWLLDDKKGEVDDWIKDEKELEIHMGHIRVNGASGGMMWYKTHEINAKDEREIPMDQYVIAKPTFFAAALQDYVCLAAQGKDTHSKLCPNTTIVDFDTGHWVHNALPDKANEELLKWLKDL